jgi:hypothetical protein
LMQDEDTVSWMVGARQHGVRWVCHGGGRKHDVGHVQGDHMSQAVEVADVGSSIRTSGWDDVERAQGGEERYAEQGRPSGRIIAV